MVGRGAIGTGTFALQARNVFVSAGAAAYEWEDEIEESGRRLIRYRYGVPKVVRAGRAMEVVAFHGSFDVDAATLDLARLEVVAADIPPQLALRSSREVMRYARIRIGASDFLLPQSSELTLSHASGEESRNVTRFDSCQQYRGESIVRFSTFPLDVDELPAAPMPAPARTRPAVRLDAGAPLYLHLESEIRFGSAAVGDRFEARVDRDVRQRGRVVAAKGSMAHGRITRLERYRVQRGRGEAARFVDVLLAAMELTGIDSAAGPIPVRGELESVRLMGRRTNVSRFGARRENAFTVDGLALPAGLLLDWQVEPRE